MVMLVHLDLLLMLFICDNMNRLDILALNEALLDEREHDGDLVGLARACQHVTVCFQGERPLDFVFLLLIGRQLLLKLIQRALKDVSIGPEHPEKAVSRETLAHWKQWKVVFFLACQDRIQFLHLECIQNQSLVLTRLAKQREVVQQTTVLLFEFCHFDGRVC